VAASVARGDALGSNRTEASYMGNQGFSYSVDIALCIDATGSMTPVIDEAKKSALAFHKDLDAALSEKGMVVDALRARVVVFRDFNFDGQHSLETSDFFSLPDHAAEYASFVNSIVADGGGDEPESGLEGLVAAMKSPWASTGSKRRQIIVVWTDATAHPIENAPPSASHMIGDLPKDFDQLSELWDGNQFMNERAKRLILYAPDAYPWTEMANHWDGVIHYPSRSGTGLQEVDYRSIIDAIANSVA
jgi:hypothetical protein